MVPLWTCHGTIEPFATLPEKPAACPKLPVSYARTINTSNGKPQTIPGNPPAADGAPSPLPKGRGTGSGVRDSGRQSASIRRGVLSTPAWFGRDAPSLGLLSPALSSLGGGEGEAAAARWLSCLAQWQCPTPLPRKWRQELLWASIIGYMAV